MTPRVRNTLAIIVIAAAAAGSFILYQRHHARSETVALVQSTAENLRADVVGAAESSEATDYSAHVRAAEAGVDHLHALDTSSMTSLVEAADDYLITAREISRRLAAWSDGRRRLGVSLKDLGVHIAADRGRADWPEAAVRLRGVVDKDFRDVRIAVESYTALLDTLPASQVKVSREIDGLPLLDTATLKRARDYALADLARLDAAKRQIANLETYQGQRAR